jgi:hypothetical protein
LACFWKALKKNLRQNTFFHLFFGKQGETCLKNYSIDPLVLSEQKLAPYKFVHELVTACLEAAPNVKEWKESLKII